MTNWTSSAKILAMGVILFSGALAAAQSAPSPHTYHVEGDVEGVHDPSLIAQHGTWYLFGTATEKGPHAQLPMRCSNDLEHWKHCGAVFATIPDWIQKESPETKDLWAPDISYCNGKYHVYYAFSAFGKNTSGIALVTNKTLDQSSPDFRWVDEGLVLKSLASDDFNAIDPNIVFDTAGTPWLSFGSFWSGIKMRRMDVATGKLSPQDNKLYALASRERPENPAPAPPGLPPDWQAIEAPFIVHHGDYYYLFVSFDLCCRGVNSNYRTVVGRSHDVTGPYVDVDGKPMLHGGGTALLTGNARWLGPGGESILPQPAGDIIVFHAYDGKTGHPFLQISTIDWSSGWPHAALEGDSPAAKWRGEKVSRQNDDGTCHPTRDSVASGVRHFSGRACAGSTAEK
jgi:arabinan endo-1,5-alpha-L-arabinosidase